MQKEARAYAHSGVTRAARPRRPGTAASWAVWCTSLTAPRPSAALGTTRTRGQARCQPALSSGGAQLLAVQRSPSAPRAARAQAGNKSALAYHAGLGVPGYTGFIPSWAGQPICTKGSRARAGAPPAGAPRRLCGRPFGFLAPFCCTDPANPQAQSPPASPPCASARGRPRRTLARRRRTRQRTRRRRRPARCRTPLCARGRWRPRWRRGASPRAARTRPRFCRLRAPSRASRAAREGAAVAARCCARMEMEMHAAHAGLGALCFDGAEWLLPWGLGRVCYLCLWLLSVLMDWARQACAGLRCRGRELCARGAGPLPAARLTARPACARARRRHPRVCLARLQHVMPAHALPRRGRDPCPAPANGARSHLCQAHPCTHTPPCCPGHAPRRMHAHPLCSRLHRPRLPPRAGSPVRPDACGDHL
jgi:hypothetical protein